VIVCVTKGLPERIAEAPAGAPFGRDMGPVGGITGEGEGDNCACRGGLTS
jgi:hypothetical protein